MKNAKVAAIVVTYNRKELLNQTLQAIMDQTYEVNKILIVDNASTDGTQQLLEKWKKSFPSKLSVIRLEENIGGAGGFYKGIKSSICSEHFDWLWLMDDDAIPSKNALESLLKFYESFPAEKRKKIGVLHNKRIYDKAWFEENNGKNFPLKAKKRRLATFVGFLIKTEVVEKVGFPRKDFFIYGDDIEYGFRIQRFGYKVLTVMGSYIYHPHWPPPLEYIFKKHSLVKKGVIKIAPWRYYYVFRNGMLMFELQPFKRFFVLLYELFDLLTWFTIDKTTAKFALRGLKDGLKGIRGKIIQPGQKDLS